MEIRRRSADACIYQVPDDTGLLGTAANCRPQMICLLHNFIVMRECGSSRYCAEDFSPLSTTVSIFFFAYRSGDHLWSRDASRIHILPLCKLRLHSSLDR